MYLSVFASGCEAIQKVGSGLDVVFLRLKVEREVGTNRCCYLLLLLEAFSFSRLFDFVGFCRLPDCRVTLRKACKAPRKDEHRRFQLRFAASLRSSK